MSTATDATRWTALAGSLLTSPSTTTREPARADARRRAQGVGHAFLKTTVAPFAARCVTIKRTLDRQRSGLPLHTVEHNLSSAGHQAYLYALPTRRRPMAKLNASSRFARAGGPTAATAATTAVLTRHSAAGLPPQHSARNKLLTIDRELSLGEGPSHAARSSTRMRRSRSLQSLAPAR